MRIKILIIGIALSQSLSAQFNYQTSYNLNPGINVSQFLNMATDAQNNYYMMGVGFDEVALNAQNQSQTELSNFESMAILVKYDQNDMYQWHIALKNLSTSSFGLSSILNVEIDSQGNVFVLGVSGGDMDIDPSPSNEEIISSSSEAIPFLAKFNVNGEFLWGGTIDGQGQGGLIDIKILPNNNLLAFGILPNGADIDISSGTEILMASEANSLIAIYDGEGALVNYKVLSENVGLSGTQISTDSNNDIIITGTVSPNIFVGDNFIIGDNELTLVSEGPANIFNIKLDQDLNVLWGNIYGTNNEFPSVSNMHVSDDNSIYFAGNFEGSIDLDPSINEDIHTASNDYTAGFLVKLHSDGSLAWARSLDSNEEFLLIDFVELNDEIILGFMAAEDAELDEMIEITINEYASGLVKYGSNGDYIEHALYDQQAPENQNIIYRMTANSLGQFKVCGLFVSDIDLDFSIEEGIEEASGDLGIFVATYNSGFPISTGVEIDENRTHAFYSEGILNIRNTESNSTFSILDLNGRLLHSGYTFSTNHFESFSAPTGIYLLRMDNSRKGIKFFVD